MNPQARTVANSWVLASDIARRTDALTLVHTHPGGGQYDCLTFHDGMNAVIHINRLGSVTVNAEHVPSLDDWADLSRHELREAAQRILRAAGHPAPQRALRTTRTTLMYRVIAALAREPGLDIRAVLHDSSGPGGSMVEDQEAYSVDVLREVPPEAIWSVWRGDAVLARLWSGWAYKVMGERLDLYRRYRCGASVADLSLEVLDR